MRIANRLLVTLVVSCPILAAATQPEPVADRLRTWSKGVWSSGAGAYTIWTDSHYFVLQGSTVDDSANVYCGVSQVIYTDKGIARKQLVRVRKTPNQSWFASAGSDYDSTGAETPLVIDEGKFQRGTCVIDKGIIYDVVEEVTDEYILMTTCGGDKIQLYRDGVSAYLPAGGGEFRSIRIENF